MQGTGAPILLLSHGLPRSTEPGLPSPFTPMGLRTGRRVSTEPSARDLVQLQGLKRLRLASSAPGGRTSPARTRPTAVTMASLARSRCKWDGDTVRADPHRTTLQARAEQVRLRSAPQPEPPCRSSATTPRRGPEPPSTRRVSAECGWSRLWNRRRGRRAWFEQADFTRCRGLPPTADPRCRFSHVATRLRWNQTQNEEDLDLTNCSRSKVHFHWGPQPVKNICWCISRPGGKN